MTDRQKLGPSGDGSDGTPLENLLREAMSARAAQITAGSLRPAAPPARRLRRTRPLYTVALPLVGLAAAASIGYLGFRSDTVAEHVVPPPAAVLPTSAPSSATPSASPSPSPSDSPSPSPSPSTAPATPSGSVTSDDAPSGTPGTPGANGGQAQSSTTSGSPVSSDGPSAPASATGTPYTFRGVSFTLPAGWTAKANGTQVCLETPGAKPDDTECEPHGVSITAYSTAADLGQPFPVVEDQYSPDGWAHQPECYSWDNPAMGGQQSLTDYRFQLGVLAGQSVHEATWQLKCDTGATFTARRWDFPKQQVFVSARGLSATYESGLQSVLGSLDVSGHPDPLGSQADALSVAVKGLTPSQQLNRGTPYTFSVTWTNTSSTTYATVLPAVAPEMYGSTNTGPPQAQGTMERQDGGSWTQLGMLWSTADFGGSSTSTTFSLAPGAQRTITYRMTLDQHNNPGTLVLSAGAFLQGQGGQLSQLGKFSMPLIITGP
ncbi:hypothetical protein [Kitasatospora sp. NBC_01302]|uniref:hypothetical protein n=1 Tax=Kitasatospora sp. NBC_01302 TaxID=2903575 RepID=UPI002E116EE2|nr:hypothetical protein OG294_19715 [Kitasatospora sp. NBC_01302]